MPQAVLDSSCTASAAAFIDGRTPIADHPKHFRIIRQLASQFSRAGDILIERWHCPDHSAYWT